MRSAERVNVTSALETEQSETLGFSESHESSGTQSPSEGWQPPVAQAHSCVCNTTTYEESDAGAD